MQMQISTHALNNPQQINTHVHATMQALPRVAFLASQAHIHTILCKPCHHHHHRYLLQ